MRRALLLGCLTLAACELEPRWVGTDLERMEEQPRYDLWEASPFFADGKVVRTPPEGTVPLEMPLDTGVLATGGEGGSPVIDVPLRITPALLELGRDRFATYCAVCHGDEGFGGSIVARNLDAPVPTLQSPEVRRAAAGMIYRHIVEGPGRMPSYAHVLGIGERWAVVAYLRQVQRREAMAATSGDVRPDEADAPGAPPP